MGLHEIAMLCEPPRAERNGGKNPIQGNKKRPRQSVKDESEASWYHLGSSKPHSSDLRECGTKRPILLRVDGRTRRGLSLTLSRAAPRPCSAWRSVPVPSCPGSLYRTSTRTLLFLAFENYLDSLALNLSQKVIGVNGGFNLEKEWARGEPCPLSTKISFSHWLSPDRRHACSASGSWCCGDPTGWQCGCLGTGRSAP